MRILANIINTDPPDSDYVGGRIRNYNSGTGVPGTPVIEELYGDVVQFFQKLLDLTGISANDLSDNETNGHQTLEALKYFIADPANIPYKNAMIQDVLSDYSVSGMGNGVGLAVLNDTDIAIADDGNDNLRTLRFDGLSWSQVGSSFSLSGYTGVKICDFGTDTIALSDTVNNEIKVFTFNGSVWSQVGSAYSITIDSTTGLAMLDTNLLAVANDNIDELFTLSWNGSSFSLVGSALSITGLSSPNIIALTTSRIILAAFSPLEIRIYDWNGSTWSQTGSGVPLTGLTGYMTLVAHNETDFTFFNSSTNAHFRNYHVNGSSIEEIGIRTTQPSSGYVNPLIKINNGLIVRSDINNDQLTHHVRTQII